MEPRWSVWKPGPAQAGLARRGGLVGLLHVDADQPPADDKIVGPLHAAPGAGKALREHPAAVEVEGVAVDAGLGIALVLRIEPCPGEGRG